MSSRLRYPYIYVVLWLALALATLAVIIAAERKPIAVATAALAWFGGIVTERLRADVRAHQDRRRIGEPLRYMECAHCPGIVRYTVPTDLTEVACSHCGSTTPIPKETRAEA